MCIELNCAIQLFEYTGENLKFSRVLHLFIDGQNSDFKLTKEHFYSLSNIFNSLHSLKIRYKIDHLIEANIVASLIDDCQQLIVFTMNGKISDDVPVDHIQDWLLGYSSRLQNSSKNYQVELCDNWFQIWL